MKLLTEDKVLHRAKQRGWRNINRVCSSIGQRYDVEPCLLMSIYMIESYYRPWLLRYFEYSVVLLSCINCLLWRLPIRNRTIGKCQIGLSTILCFYGEYTYQHARFVTITTFTQLKQIFSVIFVPVSIEILAYRLNPIVARADRIYPDAEIEQIRYIGEQFNGRYSYGLMLVDVYQQIKRLNCIQEKIDIIQECSVS